MGNREGIGGIIVAAGRGTRMGGVDKCALPLRGRPILGHAVAAFSSAVDALVVVVSSDAVDRWTKSAESERWPACRIVAGGATRQESVRAGLDALTAAGGVEVVAIHDGARPLVSEALIRACVARGAEIGAAIAAVPLTDTVKRARDGVVAETLDRSGLWAAQTPQVFRASLLREAFAWAADRADRTFTDEAGLVEAFGHPVGIVPGERANLKITEPADLIIASALMAERNGAPHG